MNRRRRMRAKSARYLALAAATLVCLAAGALIHQAAVVWRTPAVAAVAEQEYPLPYERTDGLHYNVVDEQGELILQTGLLVVPGDEYVSEDNQHYRIVSVEGDRASAILLGQFSLETGEEPAVEAGAAPAAAQPKTAVIGVYHSHGDESYVKGDGTSTIRGKGGIFDVAKSLVGAAQKEGFTVRYATAAHTPHDTGAYRRSRRTATGLIRGGAATLLDVHRDTAPQSAYEATVNGETVSKVMLVVGRANPQMQTTLNFVRNTKKVLDGEYPGLVRGIYFGRGSYNQDLSPRAILLEIGSHRTPKEHAVRTAALLGAALPEILGAAGSPGGGGSRASWSNLGWMLLIVAVGAAVYLVVASGGWRQAWDKLGGFVRREFASALAPRRPTGGRTPRGVRPSRARPHPRRGPEDLYSGPGEDVPGPQHKGGEKDGQRKEQGTG